MNAMLEVDQLAEALLREGMITRDGLERARLESITTGDRLGFTLVQLGCLDERELARHLARRHRVPIVDVETMALDPEVLRMIPAEVALRHQVVPLRRSGRVLTVAVGDPGDRNTLQELFLATNCDVEPVVAGELGLRRVVEREYGVADENIRDLLRLVEGENGAGKLRDSEADTSAEAGSAAEAPVTRLIDGILRDAVHRGASDIHFECYEKEVRVRYRIDGVMHEIMRPSTKMKAGLISRLKILSDLDIAERRLPQDGRIRFRIGAGTIDFRVSTLPTIFGEKVVLRILDRGNAPLDIHQFGMEAGSRDSFLRAILQPYGMVLVTGPTGSGKTTTLYAALARINTPDVNILTAEDPIEYNLRGINQLQVRPDIGMDFAAALRAFLRQDPDAIMIGEIRDLETASTAIKAALTGHLVFSTLHTNDAPSAVTRLMDMGVEPFNVASAVNLITAQRLVRKVCVTCAEPVVYSPELLAMAGVPGSSSGISSLRGRGCDACGGSGYRGRQGLYEVMVMSPVLRRMVLAGAAATDIRDQAVREGMITLRLDGLRKVEQGLTTLDEVLRETAA
ncbi:MAG: type IV-A pilus assembly ATPase PilB [Gemmatimonadota bacterium]|jgi:type IV pilus assembly protein PilB|nr:type IV-A pilus assembly ATPase PilB [Gemmatimonadota bacterium]